MPEPPHPSLRSGPRLLAALALTAALTATGLTAVKAPAGAAPVPGVVPALATGSPSSPGSGTPVPTTPTATTPTATAPSRAPLAPPTDFVAARVTATSVTLSWTAPVGGQIAGYDISYIRAFHDVYNMINLGNVTTVTIEASISPATQYSFGLRARDVSGASSSATNTVTVVTPVSDVGPDTTPPAAPSNLAVAAVTDTGARLSWSAATDNVGVTGYEVYLFNGWFTSQLLATVTGTSYTAAFGGERSSYYVRARDAAGNVSIASNTVPAPRTTTRPPTPSTPPPPPCRVTYRNTAEWRRGFTADVTITNTAPTPLNGWTLTFTFGGDQQVRSSWGSRFSQSGAQVTITNNRWNAVVTPGASTTVGLLGTWTASNAPPGSYTLNGLPCAAG